MLDKEFKYFLDNQMDLVMKYPNKYIMIIGDKIVGVFTNHMKAYNEGEKKYGLGKFLIQHCLPGELSDYAENPKLKVSTDQPKIQNIKLGRNDKCHCGSGKKFKHCHGRNS